MLQRRFIVNLCSHMDICCKDDLLLICVVIWIYMLQRRFIVNLCSYMDICYKDNLFLLICVVVFEKEQYLK
jgi:hypothetical protein